MSDVFTPVSVKVWGDYACFTRPEMKVERVSYDVMTPSAARGILEAIFWKPEFEWQVRRISVLRPLRRFSMTRNEVSSVISAKAARKWEEEGLGGYTADQDRTQRHSLVLRDVAYLIEAEVVPYERDAGLFAKYREQFRRRVAQGQCFRTPYLGCREFSASFGPPESSDRPIDLSMEMGRMLFDLCYVRSGKKQGEAIPFFFQSALHQGVMEIDPALYKKTDVPPPKRLRRAALGEE